MQTPLTSLLARAIGRKQLERKTCLYSQNKQTLSFQLLVFSNLKFFRCSIQILSPDLYQIYDVEGRHLVRKFGDVQTGRPKTFTFPSHCTAACFHFERSTWFGPIHGGPVQQRLDQCIGHCNDQTIFCTFCNIYPVSPSVITCFFSIYVTCK